MPGLIGILLAAGVALFAHAVGFDRSRVFYPVVLIIVGSYYVLFAVIGGVRSEVLIEAIFFAAFAALAVIGFRASLWVVVAGLALHGVFDLVRHPLLKNSGLPVWWPTFCSAYDIVAAAGLAILLLTKRRSLIEP